MAFKEALYEIVEKVSIESQRSKSSIRLRGKYFRQFECGYEEVSYDIQVTPEGVKIGPNIHY